MLINALTRTIVARLGPPLLRYYKLVKHLPTVSLSMSAMAERARRESRVEAGGCLVPVTIISRHVTTYTHQGGGGGGGGGLRARRSPPQFGMNEWRSWDVRG